MYDRTDAKEERKFQLKIISKQQTSVSMARSCPRNILCTSLPNKITKTNA
jgi:hypothetical protein